MTPLIIVEHLSPTFFRPSSSSSPSPPPAASRASSFFFKRSSSSPGRRSLWEFIYCDRASIMRLKACLLLLLGLLLCFSFILAIMCTLDTSMRSHTGNRRPQERTLMGFHTSTGDLINSFIEHVDLASEHVGHASELYVHHASPSVHTHVDDIPVRAAARYTKETALHGLGDVFSKGTKSMRNLIIANLEESCDMLDFRLFLRTLYRSGTMASADLVLLFPWPAVPQAVSDILQEESESFRKLIIATSSKTSPFLSDGGVNTSIFDAHALVGVSNLMHVDEARSTDNSGLLIWGEGTASASSEETHSMLGLEYGSVVGFRMDELDSLDGFSEFITKPSSQLRRWLCHQMLLGLLRYKFKLVILLELGGVVILDDVFSQAKKKDFLYLSLEDSTWADMASAEEHNHVPLQGDGQNQPTSGGTQDIDQNANSVPDSRDDILQTVPMHHGAVHITMGERQNHHDHTVQKIITEEKEVPKRRTLLVANHDKSLALKRKKQEIIKRTQYNGGRNDTGSDDTRKEKRIRRRTRQDSGGNQAVDSSSTWAKQEGRRVVKKSLMEMVYGKEVWECLEQFEKQRRVVSSRVIWGSMRSARGLANSMTVEIVRVALQGKRKLSFPDRALLSYLVQKSSHLLGKRTAESLFVRGNGESMVHSLDNSKQSEVFVRPHDGHKYTIVQAGSLNVRPMRSMQYSHQGDRYLMMNLTLSQQIRAFICASTTANAAAIYPDCGRQQAAEV